MQGKEEVQGQEEALARPEDFIDPVTGSWRCIRCGDCCEQIPLHPDLVQRGFDRGDGTCKNLLPDRSCAIYETRPDACRVYRGGDQMRLAEACAFVRNLGPVDQKRLARIRADIQDSQDEMKKLQDEEALSCQRNSKAASKKWRQRETFVTLGPYVRRLMQEASSSIESGKQKPARGGSADGA